MLLENVADTEGAAMADLKRLELSKRDEQKPEHHILAKADNYEYR
jgi:hypothetical protein